MIDGETNLQKKEDVKVTGARCLARGIAQVLHACNLHALQEASSVAARLSAHT